MKSYIESLYGTCIYALIYRPIHEYARRPIFNIELWLITEEIADHTSKPTLSYRINSALHIHVKALKVNHLLPY